MGLDPNSAAYMFWGTTTPEPVWAEYEVVRRGRADWVVQRKRPPAVFARFNSKAKAEAFLAAKRGEHSGG